MDAVISSPPLPPTLSHSDMARPPHEDPEYQRKIVGNIRQGLLMSSGSASGQTYVKASVSMSGNNTVIHNYAAWSQTSPVRLLFNWKSRWFFMNRFFRIRHRSMSDCHRDRPLLMLPTHRQHTPQPIIQFSFNNIIQCHHHKDQSRNYLTVLHPSCRRPHSKIQRCSTRPPSPSINRAALLRFDRTSCRRDVERVARTRSAERCTAWIIATHGAPSASGRRLAAVSGTENYTISNNCCPLR